MGIKLLNTFLKSKCGRTDAIQKICLNSLSGKKIAVDTSIYMYRYSGENALIENFYAMCSLFYEYNITPIFIFDGKPPEEKMDELKERKEAKNRAQEQYSKLEQIYKQTRDQDKKQELEQKMDSLRKQFIRIRKTDIAEVKLLIQNFGMSYINADGEADVICATLELKNKVYAVLSEDMDLFGYGCKRILRYFSLIRHSCVLYDVEQITKHINMSNNLFEMLCYVSGNDYVKAKRNVFLYYDYIMKQLDDKPNINETELLNKLITFDNNITHENYEKSKGMYHIDVNTNYETVKNLQFINTEIHMVNLMSQLNNHGFMFC